MRFSRELGYFYLGIVDDGWMSWCYRPLTVYFFLAMWIDLFPSMWWTLSSIFRNIQLWDRCTINQRRVNQTKQGRNKHYQGENRSERDTQQIYCAPFSKRSSSTEDTSYHEVIPYKWYSILFSTGFPETNKEAWQYEGLEYLIHHSLTLQHTF